MPNTWESPLAGSDGSSHKDIITSRAKAHKHQAFSLTSPILAQHRPHTQAEASYLQRRLHPACHVRSRISSTDHRRLQLTVPAQDFHIESTYYTQVLQPTPRTYANQEARILTEQPPLTHHIHKAQLKLFGSSAAEEVGAGLARLWTRRRRVHWTEQCTRVTWHWLLKSSRPLPCHSHTSSYSFLQARRLAGDRPFWSTLVRQPTCKTLLTATQLTPVRLKFWGRVCRGSME